MRVDDSLINFVANLGTNRDKAAHTQYVLRPLDDQQLAAAYRTAWLPRKIVDIPALDACRKWRDWQAEADQITKIEAEEKRLKLQAKVLEAKIKARLFGGAAVYIGTGDGDPSKPISETAKVRHLTVLTRRQLVAGDIDDDPESESFGQPLWYEVANARDFVRIHPSRLVKFIGAPLPDDEIATGAERGWGDSVLNATMDAIKNADSTAANIASLIFEAKVDVIKIPDLMARLQDKEFEGLLLKRVQLAAMAKGINGTLMLDKEEEYEQKSGTVAGLEPLLLAFLQVVSGAADIPVTRLLGQAPGGLQASGKEDTRNYYDRISSIQSLEMGPALDVLDNLIIRQALGSRPQDVWYSWSSLWQSTDEERATIGKSTADTIKALADTKLFPDDALSKASVNVLVERGVMPGLDQEVEASPMQTPADDDERAAVDRSEE